MAVLSARQDGSLVWEICQSYLDKMAVLSGQDGSLVRARWQSCVLGKMAVLSGQDGKNQEV